jgi:3-phosphoshikimate 1-carboxyvinyltransferase
MGRIAVPLRRMGAAIELSPGDAAPIRIRGSHLRGVEYRLPIASAQVKSAVLLAGLDARGETIVIEPEPTRDHTERMLSHAGVDCHSEAPPRPADRREQLLAGSRDQSAPEAETYHRRITLGEKRHPHAVDWRLPGDFSAAAFFIAAAVGVRRADLIIAGVGLNPTRTGLLKILRRMGAEAEQSRDHSATGEPVGQIRIGAVRSLKAVHVTPAETSLLIDELPVLAVLAARAEGVSVIRGAAELRHKESDRIATVTKNLRAMGAKVAELEDGWAIEGPTAWRGATIDPCGDHRIAMAFSVAALWADSPSIILNAGIVGISDPDFYAALTALAR